MPGAHTKLTSRLEVSRRQFFQWHLVEKCHIPEVKERMDELTSALRLAGYDYNFIAEEKSWKSRSRHWNTLGKTAWKVGPQQKGGDLPMPAEVANVPIWIEWDQDVGEWRKPKAKESHLYARLLTPTGETQISSSHSSIIQADEYQELYQDTDHCDGNLQWSAVTQGCDVFGSSHAPPVSSPAVLRDSYMFTPTKEVSTILHSVNTRTTAWPQQNADPLMSTNPPLVPVSEHIRNVQYEHINASSLWYQDFSTGKTTPTVSVRLPDTAHRKEHHLAPFIEAIEPSRMKSQIRSTSLSGSTLPEYTCHGQNEDQNGYAPQPSNLGSHHQHRCADFPATRSPYSQGLHVPPWSSRQWNHPQYESASSRGRNGA